MLFKDWTEGLAFSRFDLTMADAVLKIGNLAGTASPGGICLGMETGLSNLMPGPLQLGVRCTAAKEALS